MVRDQERMGNEVKEEDTEKKRGAWKDIPDEVLERSISKLCLSDRIQFRLTCKGLNNIKLLPTSIPLDHIASKMEGRDFPWLMFFPSKGNGDCTFYHPTSSATCKTQIPELAHAALCHSKYGWLLLFHPEKAYFFFHPLKKAVINLPRPPEKIFYYGMAFSSPPTSSDCVIMAVAYGFREIEIWHCCHGDDSWHFQWHINNIFPFTPSISNPVFYDGVFYCLSADGKLGIYDSNEMTWKVIPKLKGPNTNICLNYIAECDGHLILVWIEKIVRSQVTVFKLDWNEMKWLKLENLGSKMLFVSRATSLLLPAAIKGTENHIYFPMFHEETSVFYSLYTGKYQVFDGGYSAQNWCDLQQPINITWIQFNADMDDSAFQNLNWLPNADD